MTEDSVRYQITGRVAHSRIAPLLPSDWIDCSPTAGDATAPNSEQSLQEEDDGGDRQSIDFLWENAPRHETRGYRDNVKVYSHLPNGTSILDSKWVLGRLLGRDVCDGTDDPCLATLSTHCVQGLAGFRSFCHEVGLVPIDSSNRNAGTVADNDVAGVGGTEAQRPTQANDFSVAAFADLCDKEDASASAKGEASPPPAPTNFWVLKDSSSNGAGGIWIVGPENVHRFLDASTSPLFETHRYVLQEYVWPPILYQQRKCHVRVYGLVTSDGRSFCHQRCFLHVANDIFQYTSPTVSSSAAAAAATTESVRASGDTESMSRESSKQIFHDSVHITNCCANSHDQHKFAGEILADLQSDQWGVDPNGETIVLLKQFYPSIKSTLSALTERSWPFCGNGGRANNGFEYLGMDFILSFKQDEDDPTRTHPVAYLLEVNAPPSQDTATGLPHAEDLHNDVLRDLLHLWVIPNIMPGIPERPGGWMCVYQHQDESEAERRQQNENTKTSDIVPSKAVILNKIRWTLYEKKLIKSAASKRSSVAAASHSAIKGNDNDKQQTAPASAKTATVSKTESTSNTTGTQPCEKCKIDTAAHDDTNEMDQDMKHRAFCHNVASYAQSQSPFFGYHDQHTTTTASNPSKPPNRQPLFFESAGGAQVPESVRASMMKVLQFRHRDIVGKRCKEAARDTIRRMLGASEDRYSIFLGQNATTLLSLLAFAYLQCGLLTCADEVIICTENHLANVDPWLKVSAISGCQIKWWNPFRSRNNTSSEGDTDARDSRGGNGSDDRKRIWSNDLNDLVSPRTRIVAISHASNLLGEVRDIQQIQGIVRKQSDGRAHCVVDGVAVAPHIYPNIDTNTVDWYVISCHKLFGPHIGALAGSNNVVQSMSEDPTAVFKSLELGTISYEACAGIVGLGQYFSNLVDRCCEGSRVPLMDKTQLHGYDQEPGQQGALGDSVGGKHRIVSVSSILSSQGFPHTQQQTHSEPTQEQGKQQHPEQADPFRVVPKAHIVDAYRHVLETVEPILYQHLVAMLQKSTDKIRLLQSSSSSSSLHVTCNIPSTHQRLPIVAFVHRTLAPAEIVQFCQSNDILCRASTFLATQWMSDDFEFDCNEGVVRFSMAHYNGINEIERAVTVLGTMEGW